MEASSYGQLDIEFVPHHTWLRSETAHSEYVTQLAIGRGLGHHAGNHAVELIDHEFDFSGISAVMTVFPSTLFSGGGNAGGLVTADDVSMPHSRINDTIRDEPEDLAEVDYWGFLAAHELAHNLGLLDLYPYDAGRHERPAAPSGSEWVGVEFGLMGLSAWYLADASLMVTRLTRHLPDGGRQWVTFYALVPYEPLAWSRWQLGWLSEDQIHCMDGPDTTITLSPIARPGDGIAMVAVPLNRREVIVVESRRQLGYDFELPYRWSDGSSSNRPALINEGVLVYTVDTFVDSGQLPIKVAGDSGNGQVDDFPVLGVGESVTVRGYTITVTADDGNTHTVSIARNS